MTAESMKQLTDFSFSMNTDQCVHCGILRDDKTRLWTRDHTPSKVFLDEPYPENLPVISVCYDCNQNFSFNELYVACLLECVVCGSTNPNDLERLEIKRSLEQRPWLREKIEKSKTQDFNWFPEIDRVRHVILKLALGHMVFDASNPQLSKSAKIGFAPIGLLNGERLDMFGKRPSDRDKFETLPRRALFPEVGSRAMQHMVGAGDAIDGWITVQKEKYRYMTISTRNGCAVRMVLRDYLATEVFWNQ